MPLTAYQAVQRAKAELESVVDTAAQLICVLDNNGHVLRLNKTLEIWCSNQKGLDQDGLVSVNNVNGKHLHAVLHPACTDVKCYLKQLLDLSHKVITTGESAEYSGFDAELNRKLLVQMIPVVASETVATIQTDNKTDHLNQLVMLFFDMTQLDFFNPASDSLSRWYPIETASKLAT